MPRYYTVKSRFDRFSAEGGRSKNKMAGLDLNEPNSHVFSTFQLDVLDDELITAGEFLTDYTENTKPTQTGVPTEETEQTEEIENRQLNNDDIETFIEQNRNKTTKKKTASDLIVFYRWAKTVKETKQLDEIQPQELDKLLAHFVLKVRKQNGDEFEPDKLTSLFRSIDRFLRERGKEYSILTDRQFSPARETLSSKRKQRCCAGKGQKPNKAAGLTEGEIQQLWTGEQLGDHSPQSLLRTIWFNNTMFFGWPAFQLISEEKIQENFASF